MATSLTFRSADSGMGERSLEQIIGSSASLGVVLAKVDLVAPTDSTVLVLGETGTGKELVARAVHNLSRRAGRPFVKVNCAAIPFDLLESELFGHERGAFTGAIAQKIGRFETADTGSLFLDEIGDIPPGVAVEAAPGSARTGVRATRKLPDSSDQRSPHCGHTSRFGRHDCAERIPKRPVLPAECLSRRATALTQPKERYPRAGLLFCSDSFSAHGQVNSSSTSGNNRGVYFLFLAGEHTRTTEPGRTSRDFFLRWSAP
jgi:hypothetical protein